jgi:molybdenum cofactor biosynthesis enzyme MoaA
MFRSAIVKLTAVCDIDCSYCYMFNQADKHLHAHAAPHGAADSLAPAGPHL